MELIKLESLTLTDFNKENKEELEFSKKLIFDESIKKWFSGIFSYLSNSHHYDFFGRGFLIKDNDIYVGYIGIGEFNENEKSVYLKAAIDKDKRGHSYGKRILSEITDYIFTNHGYVENIRLKIDSNNTASLKTAETCGYKWFRDDFYIMYNPNLKRKY